MIRIDRRPTVLESYLVEKGFTTYIERCWFVSIRVIQEKRPAVLGADDASVSGALPMLVWRKDRILGIFFPRPLKTFRAGNAQRVIASSPTACVSRIEHIKPSVLIQNIWPFDYMFLPRFCISKQFLRFTDKLDAVAI